VTYFNVLPEHYSGETEENHEDLSKGIQSARQFSNPGSPGYLMAVFHLKTRGHFVDISIDGRIILK